MIESIIQSLLTNNKITPVEIRELYSKSTDEYERKLLSMTNRIADRFSLTYGDDFEVAKRGGQLIVSFYKYYTEVPTRITIMHSNSVNEYTINLEDGNDITYINPVFVEKFMVEYYEG